MRTVEGTERMQAVLKILRESPDPDRVTPVPLFIAPPEPPETLTLAMNALVAKVDGAILGCPIVPGDPRVNLVHVPETGDVEP